MFIQFSNTFPTNFFSLTYVFRLKMFRSVCNFFLPTWPLLRQGGRGVCISLIGKKPRIRTKNCWWKYTLWQFKLQRRYSFISSSRYSYLNKFCPRFFARIYYIISRMLSLTLFSSYEESTHFPHNIHRRKLEPERCRICPVVLSHNFPGRRKMSCQNKLAENEFFALPALVIVLEEVLHHSIGPSYVFFFAVSTSFLPQEKICAKRNTCVN